MTQHKITQLRKGQMALLLYTKTYTDITRIHSEDKELVRGKLTGAKC